MGFGPDAYGTVWFDDIQLEKSENASTFNIVENSSFDNGFTAWENFGNGTLVAANIAVSAVESVANQSIKNGLHNVDSVEVFKDAAIGGVSALIGGKGKGSKHYTNLGKQTVKRAVNAHASKGFRAGIKEVKKATKYYFKSQTKYYKDYFKGLWVDAIPVVRAVGNIIRQKFGRYR